MTGPAVPFDELLAGSSDAARTFDRRVVAWAAEHGWTTYTRAAHRNVLDPDGRFGFMFFPEGGTVQVSLRELLVDGQAELAASLRSRLDDIAAVPLTHRLPHVPVEAVLARWNTFFDDFLPDYLTAVAPTGAAAGG